MRLSSHYMFQRSITSMSDAMTNNNRIYNSLSAGQTLLKPSDDPAGASQAIVYQNALSTMDQYETARTYAQDALGQQDTVLTSMSNILTKNLMEKIIAGGNGVYSQADREVLATELEGIRKNLMDLGNTKNSNGRYIFSGYKTATKPFEADGLYRGGDTPLSQGVADSTTMQVGHTGAEVFLSGSSDDVFAALDKAINALKNPLETDEDREALQKSLDESNVSIKNAIDNLGKVQADVGTSLQQLERLNYTSAQERIQLQTRLQQTVGSDPDTWTQLVGESKMSDFAMTASMTVFQAMQKMSIFALMK
ncbi:flagellar hook protein FlgL [Erwinia typographi]|uniref:Flagellar hook protein FlgL n=1 Tax=Erwinia typographi TaxID=371042 RepID=A0A0A3Z363_9GAMM|nr:flagellar hook-associated protein FlgL [Erwinia typographi]KGT93320.1 flagellar hook protein FlgL [Erwinia typographi]